MSQQVMPDICQKLRQVQATATVCQLPRRSWRHSLRAVFPKVCAAGSQAAKSAPQEDIKKQLIDIMRTVHQVENIREQKNDTEPIRADTKSEQHTV